VKTSYDRANIPDARPRPSDGRPTPSDSRSRLSDGRPGLSDGRPKPSDGRPGLSDGRPRLSDSRPRPSDGRPKTSDARPKRPDNRPSAGSRRQGRVLLDGAPPQLHALRNRHAIQALRSTLPIGTAQPASNNGLSASDNIGSLPLMRILRDPNSGIVPGGSDLPGDRSITALNAYAAAQNTAKSVQLAEQQRELSEAQLAAQQRTNNLLILNSLIAKEQTELAKAANNLLDGVLQTMGQLEVQVSSLSGKADKALSLQEQQLELQKRQFGAFERERDAKELTFQLSKLRGTIEGISDPVAKCYWGLRITRDVEESAFTTRCLSELADKKIFDDTVSWATALVRAADTHSQEIAKDVLVAQSNLKRLRARDIPKEAPPTVRGRVFDPESVQFDAPNPPQWAGKVLDDKKITRMKDVVAKLEAMPSPEKRFLALIGLPFVFVATFILLVIGFDYLNPRHIAFDSHGIEITTSSGAYVYDSKERQPYGWAAMFAVAISCLLFCWLLRAIVRGNPARCNKLIRAAFPTSESWRVHQEVPDLSSLPTQKDSAAFGSSPANSVTSVVKARAVDARQAWLTSLKSAIGQWDGYVEESQNLLRDEEAARAATKMAIDQHNAGAAVANKKRKAWIEKEYREVADDLNSLVKFIEDFAKDHPDVPVT
jgi:hypothetical protein